MKHGFVGDLSVSVYIYIYIYICIHTHTHDMRSLVPKQQQTRYLKCPRKLYPTRCPKSPTTQFTPLAQRLQNPLIKEYTVNLIRDPNII